MNPPRSFRLFLTGFLGCGKTTLGAILAGDLGLPFLDIDQALVDQEGMPVLQILALRGEAHFRLQERHLLDRLQAAGGIVVATGSGTPATQENLALISGMGEMVFLHTPWDVLASRLQTKHAVLNPDLKVEALYQTYLLRLPFYLKARWIVAPGAGETPEELALRIRMLLKDLPCAI
jgi:shikimate kinase